MVDTELKFLNEDSLLKFLKYTYFGMQLLKVHVSNSKGVVCGSINIHVVVVLQISIKLDAYAGAGFNPDFIRQYASRMSCPCGLTVVYKMPHH